MSARDLSLFEPRADAWMEVKVYANGAEQPALFSAEEI